MLEYLARAFPDLRPVVAANPALPAVLREQVLQMGAGDLSQVSPTSPVSATTASGSVRLRTAETAALPSASTADYSFSPYTVSPCTGTPVGTTAQTVPQTVVLETSPAMPTTTYPLPASGPNRPDPGPAPAPVAAQAPPVDPSAPRSRSHNGLIAALVITLVLAVATAGTFAGILLANRGRQSETRMVSAASAAAAPAQTEGTSAGQATQPTADATTEAGAAPMPSNGPTLPPQAQTYSYQHVDTPSKNISCVLYDEGVGCSILERSYASSGMQDCPDREFSIVALAGRTEVRCGEEYLGQPGDTFHTLQYGETTVFSDYACASQSKGMTCWNTITGRGFTISRESHISF